MDWKILITPIVGGIIGYITNDIAIKMLFHPRKAKYIGKWHIPLTPGLIPKEKERIAKSIGNAVSTQLLNKETLCDVLLSEKMKANISEGVRRLFEKNKDNEETLEEVLLRYISEDKLEEVTNNISSKVSAEICVKLSNHDFKNAISDGIFEIVKAKVSESNALSGILSSFIDDSLIKTISDFSSGIVSSVLKGNSKPIVDKLISSEIINIKNYKIKDIFANNAEKLDSITEIVQSVYVKLVESCLSDILDKLDIGQIIEDKIAAFDVIELENLIFGIMKKELKAIVYLGALLGFIMGWLNLLIL